MEISENRIGKQGFFHVYHPDTGEFLSTVVYPTNDPEARDFAEMVAKRIEAVAWKNHVLDKAKEGAETVIVVGLEQIPPVGVAIAAGNFVLQPNLQNAALIGVAAVPGAGAAGRACKVATKLKILKKVTPTGKYKSLLTKTPAQAPTAATTTKAPAAKPAAIKAARKPVKAKPHGNTAGSQPATLYEKYDKDGNFQKHGISKDPAKRYTQKELDDGFLVEKATGPRKEMLKVERDLVERLPGPQNKEPWAGSRIGE